MSCRFYCMKSEKGEDDMLGIVGSGGSSDMPPALASGLYSSQAWRGFDKVDMLLRSSINGYRRHRDIFSFPRP